MNFLSRRRILAIFILGYWVFLIAFAVIDSRGGWGSDVGLEASLRTSSLARVMFMDIGGLSTVVALWIVLATKAKLRWLIAALTLVVGSFAALPYVAYALWRKELMN